jgi:hypothetical protein
VCMKESGELIHYFRVGPWCATDAWTRTLAQGTGPKHTGLRHRPSRWQRHPQGGAWLQVPAQGQEPSGHHREVGHGRDVQGPQPPTQEGQDHWGWRVPTPTLAPKRR